MSKLGLALCLLYIAASVLCIWGSLNSDGDAKGAFVLLQLPLALQIDGLHWLGLGSLLKGLSWPAAYAWIGSLTLVLLYGVGLIFSRILKRTLAASAVQKNVD